MYSMIVKTDSHYFVEGIHWLVIPMEPMFSVRYEIIPDT
jgi:hypothetical protein